VAHIERPRIQRRNASGRTRAVVHYKVRYRDASGKHHSETKTRLVDAERRNAEIEVSLATATCGEILGAVSCVLPNGVTLGCPLDLILVRPLGHGYRSMRRAALRAGPG
jgi:hypothetical protein